ncbi:hypothetical protein [Acinetobacter equi]|uniref:Uncharacterized protein n=1 Tax=Acinetobacter equi TaxID=1324350 RepID=A0A0N9V8T7_9GAMM|nr:hypothetical protein [Acinetobacter equi]ALH95593.1 hypothetical protein AOY20_08685 [Acinetobacter equi]
MKKIIIGLCFALSFQLTNASTMPIEEQEEKLGFCKEVLGAAIFNSVLETVCDFDGGVKDKLKNIYDSADCREIVPQETVENLSRDVLQDSRDRYKVFGEKKFCEDNLRGYSDLMD